MLFDLEDYRTAGVIGVNHTTADNVFWDDAYVTFRATKDAYIKALNEYHLAAAVTCTPSERHQLDIDFLDMMDAYVDFGQKARIFWPALISLPVKGDFQEGDRFMLNFVSSGDTTTGVDYHLPVEREWYYGSMKWVATLDTNGDYVYREFTQAIYDDYKNALVAFQAKVKTLALHGEGLDVFEEWVAPEIPAWAEYPELSGYVRGYNSLPIKDAQVRLTDAAGTEHVIATNDNGYYKFSKEFIYHNVALGATGSASFELPLNLLATKVDGTAIYDGDSLFQNSFFGSVNNRGIVWKQHFDMGKPARRNFKLEIITDYTDFPSVKGHVKDQDGNPVKDALVALYYMDGGQWLDAAYNKATGSWRRNTKITLFGEDKTLLTDENGYYEYPSQFIGEWFHKHFLAANPEWQHTIKENPFQSVNGYSIDRAFGFDSNNDPMGFDSYSNEYGIYAIAEQADGKFLIGGNFNNPFEGSYVNKLFRINADGTLDNTFAPQFSGNYNEAYVSSVKILSDGKILVAGSFAEIDGVEIHNVARLNADGTLDETFVETAFAPSYKSAFDSGYLGMGMPTFDGIIPDMYVNAMDVQADGKIIIGGYFYIPQINSYGIARLNADGTLDETFSNGSSLIPSKSLFAPALALVEEKSALYLEARLSSEAAYSNYQSLVDSGAEQALIDEAYIVYTTADSVADAAGTDLNNAVDAKNQVINDYFGALATNDRKFSGLGEDPRVIKALSDGKIFVGGSEWMNVGGFETVLDADGNSVTQPVGPNFGIVKLNSDGTEDVSFAVGSAFKNDASQSYLNSYIRSIIVESDGKVIVAGQFNHFGSENLYGLTRMNADGTLDSTFGIVSDGSNYSDAFKLGDDIFVSGQDGLTVLNIDASPSNISVNNGVTKSFKTSDGSVICFGRFNDVSDIFTVNGYGSQYVYGMVKFKKGLVDIAPESSIVNSSYYGNIDYNGEGLHEKQYRLNTNDFRVVLLPYIEDENGGVITPDDRSYQDTQAADRIYDYTDYFNSRFPYAWNERNETYIDTILPGENVIDVREVMVDPELGAEKLHITLDRTNNSAYFNVTSTTGYIRLVKSSGIKEFLPPGSNYWHNWGDSEMTASLYVYSCNALGGAEGQIRNIYSYGDNSFDTSALTGITQIDFQENYRGLTTLDLAKSKTTINSISLNNCYTIEELDLRGFTALNTLSLNWCKNLKTLRGFDTLSNVTSFDCYYTPAGTSYQLIDGEKMVVPAAGEFMPNGSFTHQVSNYVYDRMQLPDGSEIAVGEFQYAYDQKNFGNQIWANRVAKWKPDGSIDDNFMTNIGSGFNGKVEGMHMAADGKIIIFGDFDQFKNRPTGGIVKLSISGVSDTSFTNKIKDKINSVQDLVLLEDGSMIVAGNYYGSQTSTWGNNCQGIFKLKPNGDLDTSFKIYASGTAYKLKIVGNAIYAIGGFRGIYSPANNYGQSSIAKMDLDGVLDAAFMVNANKIYFSNNWMKGLDVDANGNVFIGFSDQNFQVDGTGYSSGLKLMKLDSTGTFDLNFHNNMGSHYHNSEVTCLYVESDGTIISYGWFNNLDGQDMGQRRFIAVNADGTLSDKSPSLGWSDYAIMRIRRRGDSLYMCGYFWNYYTETSYTNNCQYSIKLDMVDKVVRKLKTPEMLSHLYMDGFYGDLDTSSSTRLWDVQLQNMSTKTLAFESVNGSIYRIYLNQMNSLTSMSLSCNVQRFEIQYCSKLNLGSVDLGKVTQYLYLYQIPYQANLNISSNSVQQINLNNIRAGAISISGSRLNDLWLQNITANSISLSAPSLRYVYYQNNNVSGTGINWSSLTALRNLYLDNVSSLPDFSAFSALESLSLRNISWTTLSITSNTLTYLDITSWRSENQNISLSCSALNNLRLYGFYNAPTFTLNLPNLRTLQLDWYNGSTNWDLSAFSAVRNLYVYNWGTIQSLDISVFSNLENFRLSWLNNLRSITMPSSMPNLRWVNIDGTPWNGNVSTAQRQALANSILAPMAANSTTGGNFYWHQDNRITLDATGKSYVATLRGRGFNVSGQFNY